MYHFKITPDEGASYTVTAGTRDVLAWERARPGRSAQQLVENFHIGDAYWLAHRAAVRAGLFDGDRKTFEATCEIQQGVEVTVPAEGEDAEGEDAGGEDYGADDSDPTRPAL